MQTLYTSYENLGISKEVFDFSNAILKNLEDRFREIDETAEFNQLKVIQAMQKNQVSEMHFEGSTGYGYTDPGRDTLEAVLPMFSTRKMPWCVRRSPVAHMHLPSPCLVI